jgi:dephospho-CoA kinase
MRVAFSGKICSGKTTAANWLLDNVPGMVRLSFASRLKELATELFNMDPKVKDRKLLQDLGAAMRSIDKNVWINAFEKQASQYHNIVVDDLRFYNEYTCLRKLGFTIVRLEVSPETQLTRLRDTYPNDYETHLSRFGDQSETDLDNQKFDHVVTNPEELSVLLQIFLYNYHSKEAYGNEVTDK